MGNDNSHLKGIIIDKNAVEANDFWALYNAESPTTSNEEGRQLLSVFQGEPVVSGQLWITQGPMERAIKNLMIYRHPYILKYVTTWEQGGQKHLATERVRPLVSLLSAQTGIQVCLGLRTILCSLIFLIEKAMARHLNICASSIYITDNGSWRLAGFEYVWKSKDINRTLLDLGNAYRYKPGIDPAETKENNTDSIEQYAFATLCEEILLKCTKTDMATPHVEEFREYCSVHLKHKNPQMRPKLSAVLLHPYFNHEFVLIHSFLFELPLKSVQEKQDFFTGLIDRLRYFKEEVVGAQLAADLLSRMVLLDPTAQLCVTPYVLKTKSDHSAALFSNPTYTRYLMPHIKKMFRLRDAQIRLILLEYFMEFVRLLTEDELQEFILPHLLAGMNDTNDVLVAKTLRCLADLVPILGSATVIGGNRCRLFSDGRPQAAISDSTTHWVEPRSITPVMANSVDYMVSSSPIPDTVDLSGSFNSLTQTEINGDLEMTQRLSPDGGEDERSAVINDGLNELLQPSDAEPISNNLEEHAEISAPVELHNSLTTNLEISPTFSISVTGTVHNDDEENWSDWESDELQRLHTVASQPTLENTVTLPFIPINISKENSGSHLSTSTALHSQSSLTDSYRTTQSNASSQHSLRPLATINDDLSTLDIQVQKTIAPTSEQANEFDFFKDMKPVIENHKLNLITNAMDKNEVQFSKTHHKDDEILIDSSRFAAVLLDESNPSTFEGDGWADDDDVDAVNWSPLH